jgi:VWFA-related protein
MAVLGMLADAWLLAQSAPPASSPQRQRFRVQIQLVTIDAVVRDGTGHFVPDLRKEEFEVYEDGAIQDLASLTLVHAGHVTNVLAPPSPAAVEGLVLPPVRVQNDTSGRIFLFVIDDLHMAVGKTPIIRDLFQQISKYLLHDGDMFGMVSTGTSAIAVDMTYDRTRFEQAVRRITGNGLSPTDIIQGPSGSEGPTEVRYRAHAAFSTVTTILDSLEKIHDRRKVIVYVSDGYDFAPFQNARFGTDASSPFQQSSVQNLQNQVNALDALSDTGTVPRQDPNAVLGSFHEEFADAQLARELDEVTRSANRANATIYTIDPRGVIAAGDVAENVDPREWQNYVAKSQDTLRVLAAATGGSAVINQNQFDDALKRIDAEASDYYMLGYYSKNLEVTRRLHQIDVRVTRPGLSVWARKTYTER